MATSSCSSMRTGEASIWEEASRRIRGKLWLHLHIYSTGFWVFRTQSHPKSKCRKWEERVHETSPEGSEDLQWWLPGTSTTPRYPETTGGGFQLPRSGKKLHHCTTTLHQSSHCYRKSRDIYRRGWGAGDMMVASMCNSKFIPQIPTASFGVRLSSRAMQQTCLKEVEIWPTNYLITLNSVGCRKWTEKPMHHAYITL